MLGDQIPHSVLPFRDMGTLQQKNPVQFKTSVAAHFTFNEEELKELLELVCMPVLTVETKVSDSSFLLDLQHELQLLLQDR
jgi:hypothetical protein